MRVGKGRANALTEARSVGLFGMECKGRSAHDQGVIARAAGGGSETICPIARALNEDHLVAMTRETKAVLLELWRRGRWIVAMGAVLAVLSVVYLAITGELFFHMVVATLGGVFLTVVLGSGLMAASFFSDKSGHDAKVTDATRT